MTRARTSIPSRSWKATSTGQQASWTARRPSSTGGDSGIGAAVAIAFAKEGADVAIAYYSSDDDAQAVAERIRELGRRALVFKGDVGDEAFCRDMVEGIAAEWGRLDVLVNNAGEQTPAESILDLTQEQLVRTFQTNIFSMFYLVKAASPTCPREAPS